MTSSPGSDVASLLADAAQGTSFTVQRMAKNKIRISSPSASLTVDLDLEARTYALLADEEITVSRIKFGDPLGRPVGEADNPFSGAVAIGPGIRARGSATFDPVTRRRQVDPSGRIDAFVRRAIEPHGWRYRSSPADRAWIAAMVMFVSIFCAVFTAVLIHRWTSGPGVWTYISTAVFVIVVLRMLFTLWRGLIQGRRRGERG